MAVIFQVVVIWILTSYGPVGCYRRLGGIRCALIITYTVPMGPNRAPFPFPPLYIRDIFLTYSNHRNGSSMFPGNFGIHLQEYTLPQPKRPQSE